jgi:hypothetical protein
MCPAASLISDPATISTFRITNTHTPQHSLKICTPIPKFIAP